MTSGVADGQYRGIHEAHISAEQSQEKEDAWLQGADEDQGRASCAAKEEGQGKEEARRMNGRDVAAAAESIASEGLPKEMRLLRRRDFQTTLKQGRIVRCGGLLVAAKRNPLEFSRLGIAVAKGVGKAVVRNRFKRRVREAFRRRADIRMAGLDVVVVLKRGQADQGLCGVVNDLFGALLRVPRV